MPSTPSRLVLPILGISLFSGCIEPGISSELEFQYSRKFITYSPGDGKKVQVLDEYHASATRDGICQATLVQTILTDPASPPRTHMLECLPVADPRIPGRYQLELSLRGSQDESAALTYIFEVAAESPPELSELRAADGSSYQFEEIPKEDQPEGAEPENLTQKACGEVELDLARQRLTVRPPTRPLEPVEFKLPENLNNFLERDSMPDSNSDLPWTGIAALDFLDTEALETQSAAILTRSASKTQLGIPCPYHGTLRVEHAVKVPRTVASLAAFLDPQGGQEWRIEYTENSFVRMEAHVTGRILPEVGEAGIRWILAGDSHVSAQGDYQYQKDQLEERRLNGENKSLRIQIYGEGDFVKAMRLDELAESATIDSTGEVTLTLGSPPVEMEVHEVRRDLLSGAGSEQIRTRRIFFPGKYTQVRWPSATFEFTRYSEPRLGVRATINDEIDLPALWTSNITLDIAP